MISFFAFMFVLTRVVCNLSALTNIIVYMYDLARSHARVIRKSYQSSCNFICTILFQSNNSYYRHFLSYIFTLSQINAIKTSPFFTSNNNSLFSVHSSLHLISMSKMMSSSVSFLNHFSLISCNLALSLQSCSI